MKRPEQDLQKACVKWFRMQYPQHRIIHIPNGGKRSVVEASIFKAMGVSAGFPDLMILRNDGKAFFVEMKAGKGKQTESQMEWENWFKKSDFLYDTVNSFDEFQRVVKFYIQ